MRLNLTKKQPDAVVRFWRNVRKTDSCWEWTGYRHPQGYGIFNYHGGTRAPRFSWFIHFGPIPNGLFVCHHCDNPSCIRPEHLFLGTQKDNMQDMMSKKSPNFTYGERAYAAKLTAAQVLEIRRLYKGSRSKPSQLTLANHFKVSRRAISAVVNRQSWAHIKDEGG